ncbi:sarcosine oxidase subunit alpha [Kiloniella sp. b19]|uniref:sarcosine oxidase subunit alpha n=1 Tax=Kiloniella sp. GXU_MW_B19 TaxID=3141326 RepID=UPI0031DAEC3D
MAEQFRSTSGTRVDRSKVINFTFNGRKLTGVEGDTLASALVANGIHLVGRSFKTHRPRGIVSCGSDEPSALVQLETGPRSEPNLRATQIELYEGLEAKSVNCWPSVDFDILSVTSLASRLFVAGFYYKTFMSPKSFWMTVYEPLIRRIAGLGVLSHEKDPDTYDHMNEFCEVLVVGSGPAGLTAALEAGRAGGRVVLVDEQAEFGGSLNNTRDIINGRPAQEWVAEVVAELEGMDNVRLLKRSNAFGYYDHNYITVHERRTDHMGPGAMPELARHRIWHFRTKQVVLATGSHERPLVFADNDRPGIMLASAGQTYANRYGALPGKRGVVFTNNDSAYKAALDLLEAGMEIAAVVDLRESAEGELAHAVRKKGVEVITGSGVVDTLGKKHVNGVMVASVSSDGEKMTGQKRRIDCDTILMSGGWNPAVHLFSQSIGKLRYDDEKACFLPNISAQKERTVGACSGAFTLQEALDQGAAAGAAAAKDAGTGKGAVTVKAEGLVVEEQPLKAYWVVPTDHPVGQGKKKHFVDYQHDVTAADIMLAAREGMHSVEHMKRFTTNGMATDQGKMSNVNGLAILSHQIGKDIPKVGTTTFRPPYTPVTFGALAGRSINGDLADPVRRTPMYSWHVENGATFEPVGQWQRAWYYPKAGEDMHAAVARETKALREGVGILDASTLGKIDIQGKDAAEFLNRIYTNAWLKLPVGSARYGFMLKEDGMVFDDGVTTRLGENHFHMTTTTGGAAGVLDWLEEYLQTEWPDLEVYCTSVTEEWSTLSIGGPKARALMEELCSDIDFSQDAFPFMTMREGTVAGVPARVFRISFTGDLSYEINVRNWHGLHVWKACMEAGKKYDITPYGTETMHVLRAEKGFIIVGQDTDGTQTPQDLGMDWIVSKKKGDFVGRRSFAREDTAREGRKQLVGLITENPKEVLTEGAQLTNERDHALPAPMLGHVTSSYWSPNLGHSIAMAMCKDGLNRTGEWIYAHDRGKVTKVKIVSPVFYDAKGERRDG